MNYYNYNGKLLPESTAAVGANSRALRYGDGLFETIKFRNGHILLEDEHFARLWKGLKKMQFVLPKLFTPEKLKEEIEKTLKKNKHTDARVRMAILRGDGGMFDTASQHPNFIIQSWQLPPNIELLNSNGLSLCVFRDAYKACDAFCNVKNNNYLPYIMAAFFAKENQCNDALVLNEFRRIADSSIANVYVIKNGQIITPALTEGCIDGIMRQYLITQLPALGFNIKEDVVDETTLIEADEIFLTNSIFNIRWVAQVDAKSYGNELISKIVDALHQNDPEIFH